MVRNIDGILPVSLNRVRGRLQALGVHVLVDAEGDLGVFAHPHFYLLVEEAPKPIILTASFHREVDIRFLDRCYAFTERYNRSFYAPKLFTEVSDEGKVSFRISHCFNWLEDVSDSQIDAELHEMVHAATHCFNSLEEEFPDEWAQ